MGPPRKQKRTQFTVTERLEIIEYKTKNPKASQDTIAATFAKKWDKPVGRSTVGDILREENSGPIILQSKQ